MLHVLLGAALAVAAALAHPDHAPPPPPSDDEPNGRGELPPALAPGQSLLGVRRAAPEAIRDGILHESPALAVTPSGEVVVAVVSYEDADDRERIWVRRGAGPGAPLGEARAVSDGQRAWHPRLAAGSKGEVWLAWCGAAERPARGDHRRRVWLRRLAPAETAPIDVDAGSDARDCDPDVTVAGDGTVHVAWERAPLSAPLAARIAYRRFDGEGRALGPAEILSHGPFDRRPALLARGPEVFAAWDNWVSTNPTGALDPDYDLFLRRRDARGRWSPARAIDDGPGIQAGASLAAAPGGGVLVAYHSTQARGSLVKGWALRRVRGARVTAPAGADRFATAPQPGEMQGAEFPSVATARDGTIFLTTRPSQGAYLHRLDGGRIESADLTQSIWGARGLKPRIVAAPDGSVLVARRGGKEALLERFSPAPGAAPPAPVRFRPWRSARKPKPSRPPAPVPGVLFGDVHMHSGLSDGTGPSDEIYARARVRGLDFAVLTDHDTLISARMLPSEHAEIAWVTDAFNQLPGFATLHAYEWTTAILPKGSGHRNIYFRDHAPTPVYSRGNGHGDTRSLFAALRGERAFAVPHHTGWTGTDWENADEAIQRNVEIVSVHGVYDAPGGPIPQRGGMPGMFAVDGLKRGLRFGFVGGSDGHGLEFHHGIGRRRDPWGHALTGVYLDRPSRAAIWDALHARAAFTTSGPRMRARLAVDGVPMGAEGKASAAPLLRLEAHGTSSLEEVEILRDGEPVHSFKPASRDAAASWRDERAPRGRHSYHLRARQRAAGGEVDLVWTSPVFVDL